MIKKHVFFLGSFSVRFKPRATLSKPLKIEVCSGNAVRTSALNRGICHQNKISTSDLLIWGCMSSYKTEFCSKLRYLHKVLSL